MVTNDGHPGGAGIPIRSTLDNAVSDYTFGGAVF